MLPEYGKVCASIREGDMTDIREFTPEVKAGYVKAMKEKLVDKFKLNGTDITGIYLAPSKGAN